MSYRDDRDADLARIEALEGELAAAKRKIAELETPTALVRTEPGALATRRPPGAFRRWLGAPLTLEFTHTFDKPFPTDKLEELLATLRAMRREQGIAELLKSSLTWYSALPHGRGATPALTVSVVVKDGRTVLTVQDRLHQIAGGIYGGVGGGVGGGGLAIPLMVSFFHPVLAPLMFVGWYGSVLLLSRTIFTRIARSRELQTRALFERIRDEINRSIA